LRIAHGVFGRGRFIRPNLECLTGHLNPANPVAAELDAIAAGTQAFGKL
jgi:hypothetical protein